MFKQTLVQWDLNFQILVSQLVELAESYSRVILGGDRRETTLDDGKWDQGGFQGL